MIWTVSGLSLYDRAVLSAQFWYLYDDRLNCDRFLNKELKRRISYEEAEKRTHAKFGCKTIYAKPKYTIDGVEYFTCLCNFKHPLFDVYLELSDRLDQGILPELGSVLDQSARIMDAVRLIKRLKIEAQLAQQEAQIKENKTNGRQSRRV